MANGVEFTASGDTGEGDLSGLFTGLDARNPDQLFLRLDPESAYPVYGDDSTFEETAPTSGRLYLKLAKDGNHLLWGNFSHAIQGTDYLRSERTLYGLQGKWASQAQTDAGKPKAQVDVYAASPDNLPQRDVFGATGGTVYFLQRQDISVGSEVLSIELRDPVTGRVLSSQPLVYGKDYDINYFQGVVTLTTPLASSAGLTGATPPAVNLVAQYEYAPSGFAVTGQNYGGRAEAQLAPNLRFGITAQVEKTGTANQTAMGVDATYDLGDASYVRVELAQSDGPGFGSSFSSNAGLTVTNGAVTAGSGRAGKFETRLTFSDFGGQTDGYVSAYAEAREAGFSSLDYQVPSDETLWGVATVLMPSEALQVSLAYDAYDNSAGDRRHEGRLEAHFEPVGNWAYQLGLTHSDQLGATGNGTRTDIDARITHHFADDSNLYVFGQYTLQETGLGRDDRFGIGGETPIGETGWAFEGQVSDGSSGLGAMALVSQKSQTGDSTYFGYELDPNRTLAGSPVGARDQGKFIFGGRRQVSPSLSTWGENSYDLFGQRKSLTSAYGVDYAPQEALRYSASFELGDVIDPVSGNYRRTGVSAGVTYQQDERWSARARLGYRLDEDAGGDATTWALTARARYKPNETERLSFNLEAVDTTSSLTAVTAGRLVDASLGYARRPVADDQLNLLFKYRYLYDMFGQTIDGSATTGPRQISHVLSVDGEYDLSRSWTIGGKLGYRLSSVSPSLGSPFARNDAWLAVASARYHIVHKWDGLLEARALGAVQAQTTDFGLLGAVYRHVNNNAKIGVGYNFGRFSDDLTDLTHDDQGLFVNFVAKF